MQVLSPNGLEKYEIGQQVLIRWHTDGLPVKPADEAHEMTVLADVLNVNSFSNYSIPLIYKGGGWSSTRSYTLWLQQNGSLHLTSADASGEQSTDTAAGLIATGRWHHVAGVVDRESVLSAEEISVLRRHVRIGASLVERFSTLRRPRRRRFRYLGSRSRGRSLERDERSISW